MTPVEEAVTHSVRMFSSGFSFCRAYRLTCPSDALERELLDALRVALDEKGFRLEEVDLQPAPAKRLNALTERLIPAGSSADPPHRSPPTVLAVLGLDLLEGKRHDAPTYPFRSRFQFDRQYLWLFIGRDRERLGRLFNSRALPLYQAAMDITPEAWRELR